MWLLLRPYYTINKGKQSINMQSQPLKIMLAVYRVPLRGSTIQSLFHMQIISLSPDATMLQWPYDRAYTSLLRLDLAPLNSGVSAFWMNVIPSFNPRETHSLGDHESDHTVLPWPISTFRSSLDPCFIVECFPSSLQSSCRPTSTSISSHLYFLWFTNNRSCVPGSIPHLVAIHHVYATIQEDETPYRVLISLKSILILNLLVCTSYDTSPRVSFADVLGSTACYCKASGVLCSSPVFTS